MVWLAGAKDSRTCLGQVGPSLCQLQELQNLHINLLTTSPPWRPLVRSYGQQPTAPWPVHSQHQITILLPSVLLLLHRQPSIKSSHSLPIQPSLLLHQLQLPPHHRHLPINRHHHRQQLRYVYHSGHYSMVVTTFS